MVFLQTGALPADSVAEVRRISTSTLACSSAEKQREGGERERREEEIWKPLQAGSCILEWLIQSRREGEKERGRLWHMITIMNLISVHM